MYKHILCLALFLALLGITHTVSAEQRLTFATGGTSGVYFPLGGAIAQIISSESNGAFNITPQASGASGENIRLIENGDVDMAIVQNDVANSAYYGTPPFKDKFVRARAIARLYPEYLHVVANTKSGIKTMSDFKGKKVSVGARGSGNELNSRQIFNLFGLTYKNIRPKFLPYGETAEQFKNHQLDGFLFTIGTPNPAIQDITAAQTVKFINIEGPTADAITEQFPYMVKDSIPANTYKGQTQPVNTLSVQAILVVKETMSDDMAYALTKALFENIPAIAKAHNKGAEISLARAKDGITIPFHPGALKYFQEKNLK